MTKISIPNNTRLVSSMTLRAAVNSGRPLNDSEAATICSYWHGPSGHGVTFSRLSHGIAGGVDLDALLAAIDDARYWTPYDDGRADTLFQLDALESWATAKAASYV